MLIVEFCGTPGCGKTTLCDAIELELRKQGYKVRNLQKRAYAKTRIDRVKEKIERIRFRHYLPNYRLKVALRGLKTYLAEDSAINWVDRILESAYKIRKAEKAGIEVGLFDEGCLQFITSVFHQRTVVAEMQELVSFLEKEIYKERTVIFDCQLEVTQNYYRLVKRGRAGDRFLNGNIDDSIALLKQKRENINTVINMLRNQKVVEINQNESVDVKGDILEAILMR